MHFFQSKYCYSGTDVLINKENIRNQNELTIFENLMTTARLAELKLHPIIGKFDFTHLQRIHHYIFQDVYHFAGEIRTENIHKNFTKFAQAPYIAEQADKIFQQLIDENYLTGLQKRVISSRIAYYMGEINALHPFREGNGRTQREFFRCLAQKNNYELDWNIVNKKEILNSSIKSMTDYHHLADVIYRSIKNA